MSWAGFERSAPDLAAAVKARLESGSHALLGSLRADGFPRISGVVPTFADGELWLGMPESVKAADLRRDPRMSLHSAGTEAAATDGEAKLHGRAVEVTGGPALDGFVARIPHDLGPGGLALFRIELEDASLVRLNETRDAHVVESWRAGTVGPRVRLAR